MVFKYLIQRDNGPNAIENIVSSKANAIGAEVEKELNESSRPSARHSDTSRFVFGVNLDLSTVQCEFPVVHIRFNRTLYLPPVFGDIDTFVRKNTSFSDDVVLVIDSEDRSSEYYAVDCWVHLPYFFKNSRNKRIVYFPGVQSNGMTQSYIVALNSAFVCGIGLFHMVSQRYMTAL